MYKMDFQRNPCLKLVVVLIVIHQSVHSQSAGTDCNGKTYYCVDDQQFQVCVDLPDGKSQTADDQVYPCPTDSFCDNAGQLECDSQTRPTTTAALTPTISTASLSTTTTEPSFTCTQPGRFPNKNDCHRYYTCTQISTGLRQTESSCLSGMAFNPASQRCSSDQSPCHNKFTCQSSGRFPDPEDSFSYFWCLKLGSGYKMFHMSCVFGQAFDPVQGRCPGWIGIRKGRVRRQDVTQAPPVVGPCCNCCILGG